MLGLLSVYSASFAVGYFEYGNAHYFIFRQLVFAGVGLLLMLGLMWVDYRRLRRPSVFFILLALALLGAVLLPGVGVVRNGAARWLSVGPVEVQPSELAKLAVILYISAWLASRGPQVKQMSLGFLPFVLMVGLVGGLVVVEPDMGTAVIIVLVATTLFFMAGAPISHLAILLVVGSFLSYLLVLTHDYRLARITAYVSAENDPQGTGFHVLQLLNALGSGGLLGLGWGASRQKFFYIPGAHTDGVFAILGEELGFVGAVAVMLLFVVLLARGLRIAALARDRFGRLLAVGITSWIGYQALINMGGMTGVIPLTGVPLPLFSYGGSALVSNMIGLGLLLSVSRYIVPRPEAATSTSAGPWGPAVSRRRLSS